MISKCVQAPLSLRALRRWHYNCDLEYSQSSTRVTSLGSETLGFGFQASHWQVGSFLTMMILFSRVPRLCNIWHTCELIPKCYGAAPKLTLPSNHAHAHAYMGR